jgi:hypothetical protein
LIGGAPLISRMRSSVDPSKGMIYIMGAAAHGWLLQSQRGKVLAVVTHAAYLLTNEGELVWLATTESPMHRRCMQLKAPLPRPAVDSRFTIRDQAITLESGTNLDFRASRVWESPALLPGDVIDIGQLPDILFAVCESFLTMQTPVGYGAFILPVLQIAKKLEFSIRFQPKDILTMTAWQIVEMVARDCLSHDLPGVFQEAKGLIGLGEGLTPAGDDFLGGLFFARHLLACSYPFLLHLEFSGLRDWIAACRPRTNLISYILLKDNADGHALDPLNRFGVALLTNQPEACIISTASELIKVGHSTGWSLLAGFLVGMLLAFVERPGNFRQD